MDEWAWDDGCAEAWGDEYAEAWGDGYAVPLMDERAWGDGCAGESVSLNARIWCSRWGTCGNQSRATEYTSIAPSCIAAIEKDNAVCRIRRLSRLLGHSILPNAHRLSTSWRGGGRGGTSIYFLFVAFPMERGNRKKNYLQTRLSFLSARQGIIFRALCLNRVHKFTFQSGSVCETHPQRRPRRARPRTFFIIVIVVVIIVGLDRLHEFAELYVAFAGQLILRLRVGLNADEEEKSKQEQQKRSHVEVHTQSRTSSCMPLPDRARGLTTDTDNKDTQVRVNSQHC